MSTPTRPSPEAELSRFLRIFGRGAAAPLVAEVRAFDVPQRSGSPATLCGFFDVVDNATELQRAVLGLGNNGHSPSGIYLTLNPVQGALLARAKARLTRPSKKALSVNDTNVLCRRWLLVDVDPVRPSGISATDAEKAAALDVIQNVRSDLLDRGWPAPMMIDSGNGFHLWFRIDVPSEDGGLVERALKALAAEHDDPAAKVDTTVFNPSRIAKIPGTWSCKGDDTEDRPHRLARVLEMPQDLDVVPLDLIEALAGEAAAKVPAATPRSATTSGNGDSFPRLRITDWLNAHKIGFRVKARKSDGWTVYQLAECPFNPDHAGTDCCIYQEESSGRLGARCSHNSCSGFRWDQFKEKIGPTAGYYDKATAARVAKPSANGTHNANPSRPAAGSPANPSRFQFIDCATFDAGDYRPEWLVSRVLVRGSPAVIAGPTKTLKTSLSIDLAVSLASGTDFLGRFKVYKPVRVAVVSGESGRHTLQEVARRVCHSRGLRLADLAENIQWCFDLPTLSNLAVMAEYAGELARLSVDAHVLDPFYLSLGDIDAKNLFEVGNALRVAGEALQKAGRTPIICHHANRQLPAGEAMGLQHLAYSGLEQYAGQWLLLNRAKPYRMDGNHDLLLSAGGRDGQGGLWSLRIEEGTLQEDFTGRVWNVAVIDQKETLAEEAEEREAEKRAAAEKDAQANQGAVLRAIDHETEKHGGATLTSIRERTGFNSPKLLPILAQLVDGGTLEECEFKKKSGNGATKDQAGYRRCADGR